MVFLVVKSLLKKYIIYFNFLIIFLYKSVIWAIFLLNNQSYLFFPTNFMIVPFILW